VARGTPAPWAPDKERPATLPAIRPSGPTTERTMWHG